MEGVPGVGVGTGMGAEKPGGRAGFVGEPRGVEVGGAGAVGGGGVGAGAAIGGCGGCGVARAGVGVVMWVGGVGVGAGRAESAGAALGGGAGTGRVGALEERLLVVVAGRLR